MDTEAQEYWQDLEAQAALLHQRLWELFESKPVRFLTDPLRIPNTPEAKLSRYLHMLQTRHPLFALDKSKEGKQRRDRIIQTFCVQPDNFPEKYFDNLRAREEKDGMGSTPISDKRREKLMRSVNTDQSKRLKQWVKHLSDPDNGYPIWFRYFVLSNVVKLKEFDTQKSRFPKRSKSSTANFPELNPSVVRSIYRHITEPEFHQEKKRALAKQYFHMETRDQLSELPDVDANFARLYEFWTHDFLRQVKPDDLKNADGQWVHFEGPHLASDLTRSVSGFNTGWCIANAGQSYNFLAQGDIWVYYSALTTGEIVVPRISIRVENDRVREVRGSGPNQEVDDHLLEIAREKLADLPGGKDYFQTVEDTRTITKIVDKISRDEPLTRQDLMALYEVERSLSNFGMRRDPRISQALSTRDVKRDMAFLFGCDPNEVALQVEELDEATVVCVFDVNRKQKIELRTYEEVFAIIGNADFERMPPMFPNVGIVSGKVRTGNKMEKIAIVGGTISHVNTRQDLKHLVKVGGSALFSSSHCNFEALESIGGDLHLSYSTSKFPSLKSVGGDVRISGTLRGHLNPGVQISGQVIGEIPFERTLFDLPKS